MTDLEYLLNSQLNPLQEMEARQTIYEIVELYEKIIKNQNTLGITNILLDDDKRT